MGITRESVPPPMTTSSRARMAEAMVLDCCDRVGARSEVDMPDTAADAEEEEDEVEEDEEEEEP